MFIQLYAKEQTYTRLEENIRVLKSILFIYLFIYLLKIESILGFVFCSVVTIVAELSWGFSERPEKSKRATTLVCSI